MVRRLRAALVICLAPFAVAAISLVPSGSAAFGYSGGPPPPTTCPPDATTNPAGHCPPGSNGGGGGQGHGGGGGHGHGHGASTAASGPNSGAGSGQVATGSAAAQVEAVSQSRGTTNQAGAALKDQLAHGSTVPVTHTDVIELVALAIVGGAALALIGRAWLHRRRLA